MFDVLRAQTPPEAFRYERKFLVESLTRDEVRSVLRLHPAAFQEIFHERFVNNIYFDTPTFTSYDENVAGLSNRVKVRIRWYGDDRGEVERPVLELKIKSNHAGAKASYRLEPFVISNHFSKRELEAVLDASELPDTVRGGLRALRPVLFSRYHRQYLLSRDERFRVTLDRTVRYRRFESPIPGGAAPWDSATHHIVELKYAVEWDDGASRISAVMPFRNTKSSKYVNGVDFLRSQGQL